jgi:hypothetical protein
MWTDHSPIRRFVFVTAVLGSISSTSTAQPPAVGKDWKLDTIKLKNGYVFKGVILEETVAGVRFQHVRRSNGRPTVFLTALLRRTEIEKIDKITDAEREQIKSRLKELDPTGEGERKRMESLELKVAEWNGNAKAGLRYDSDHFSLISSAPEEVVRRSAIRLEQIYTAYAHFLPPRFAGGKPTTIVLYPSTDAYQEMLKSRGWAMENPAFFDPSSNRIFCGSNLQRIGADLEKCRIQHQEQRAEIAQKEAVFRQLYGKKPMELAQYLQKLKVCRDQLAFADQYNDRVYDNETKRLSAILYHEAFHAYACNFVYPPAANNLPGELPRWLNEGLAQIFETAIVEAGELRVGHADKDRLERAKECLRKGEMMPLGELLVSGSKHFIVQHRGDRLASDRNYLASWALASYLTFDRRLLGTTQLDEFVRSMNKKDNAEQAFTKLTGQKLPAFEKEFHAWLTKLQSDGSLMESLIGKDK